MTTSIALAESASERPASTVQRFSSGEWPEAERRARLCDVYARNIMRLDLESSPQCPLNIEATFRMLPGLDFAFVTTSATRVRRTAGHLVNDDLVLNVGLAGGRTLSQRGREAVVGDGEAILTTCAEVSTTEISKSRFVTFRLPRKPISALMSDLDDCMARPIRRDTESLRLLVSYAGVLRDTNLLTEPAIRRMAVTHIYDLVALALGASRDITQIAEARGARAARLRAIKADIADNLARDDLSAATVAARHRLPVRYVQRLFETEGTTFTDFVLDARLAHAHRMLTNVRLANLKISAVACEAGFGDPSYFNRTFRRRYGATPSDVRAQIKAGG